MASTPHDPESSKECATYQTRSKTRSRRIGTTPAVQTVSLKHMKVQKRPVSRPRRGHSGIRLQVRPKASCTQTLQKSSDSQSVVHQPETQKQERYKANISKGAQILTKILLAKSNSLLQLRTEASDDDEDYVELDGKPDEIDYVEEEYDYLRKLNATERQRLFSTERKIIEYTKTIIPQRFKILNYDVEVQTKAAMLRKLDLFYTMETTDNEYSKLGQWIEYLDRIPFGKYTTPKVSISDESSAVVDYLQSVRKNLDSAVFGHSRAKNQVIQMISQQITNPSCSGNCIGIQGPPGNGKTTLVREGIAKCMNRPFFCIPLGGMENADFFRGHEYTYEGSKPGRIVEILMQGGTMDPIIYFDELDKLSHTPKGDEIANLLCHLTDLSQNKDFQDKYFSGLKFDLSKALFIFSYNDEESINKILLDRMIKIRTKGFTLGEKLTVAQKYLYPSLCREIGLSDSDCCFKQEHLRYIIENYTQKELGVRNLRRCLETILGKVNVLKLIHGTPNSDNIVSYRVKQFSLPFSLTPGLIDKFLQDVLPSSSIVPHMYT